LGNQKFLVDGKRSNNQFEYSNHTHTHARTHAHTHPFNGPFCRTTQVSLYQKGKTNLDFTEARDSEWQWNQLGRMQVCTTPQTDNQNNTHHSVFYRPDALPAAQPTASSKQLLNVSCLLLLPHRRQVGSAKVQPSVKM